LLILIRHPPVDMPPGICYGRQDVDVACASDIDDIVNRIPEQRGQAISSSPSRRCARVAAAIAERFHIITRYDDRLRELDFGAWEGLAWADVPRSALDEWAADPLGFAPPAGESGAQLISRVQSFYDELSAPSPAHIIVSHGGPLRILAALVQGARINLLAPSPPLGSVECLESPS